jgi:nucleoside-diphosphate-sugar epimerase
MQEYFQLIYNKGGVGMKRIFMTGALGQIGVELVDHLRQIYGNDKVFATDISDKELHKLKKDGPFGILDVRDGNAFSEMVSSFKPDTIFHLAGILSANAEKAPQKAWDINTNGLCNALEIARNFGTSLFFPSSIAAFGPGSPVDNTPQDTIQRPSTIYGISKVTGELLCDYYHLKYGVDTRGVRFPGLISHEALPGGGTTDYAVHIYYEAIREKKYTSFIGEGTFMDMMYMPDALEATVKLMEADPAGLVHRNCFNITAMSFAPEHVAEEIRKHIPDFVMAYDVDPERQAIAESWPNSIDATCAAQEWGFAPRYDLGAMTSDMLEKIALKFKVGNSV